MLGYSEGVAKEKIILSLFSASIAQSLSPAAKQYRMAAEWEMRKVKAIGLWASLCLFSCLEFRLRNRRRPWAVDLAVGYLSLYAYHLSQTLPGARGDARGQKETGLSA